MHKIDIKYELKRGGVLVRTTEGNIQFGIPPETIKDTMLLPDSVPKIFVLTREMFNWIKGISVAEIEFPLYFNFFIKKSRTKVICTEEQKKAMCDILQEALFGPVEFDISLDYDIDNPDVFVTDLKNEMNHFRGNFTIDDLVEFVVMWQGKAVIGNVEIASSGKKFSVRDGGKQITEVDNFVEYKASYLVGERLSEPFVPPLFGITCLGPSHGFDPTNNTSGFIIWINHQGIMVDPPVNSTEWLLDSNVNPKFITGIILSHCHADHDAGTFQKILEEQRITIYSTTTVLDSFLRKYSATAGVSAERLKTLFDFSPVKIGRSMFIHNAKFDMFYTLHSIPCIGFKMTFQNQSFVYSSDHNNDPEAHKALFESGVLSEERYAELSDFPWDSKVIFHEAGIPPLHTPVSYLDSLPEQIKKRTFVYHIAEKDFPKNTSLSLAKFGIENTISFNVKPPLFEKAHQILGLLNHLDFAKDLSVKKAQEFINIVHEEKYKKGELIIKQGSSGDKFYIIHMGNVSVDSGNLDEKKIYGSYDYFGEVAIVTQRTRAADVYAETDVVLYTIERDKFLSFIAGTEFENTLHRLARIRTSETWNLLSTSKFFRLCTATQKTWLESIFVPQDYKKGTVLYKENGQIKNICIIRSGEVVVERNGGKIRVLEKGDFIGSISRMYYGQTLPYTYRTESAVSLFSMKKDDIIRFADKNPGLLMRLKDDELES